MSLQLDEIIKDLEKLNKRWEAATYILGTLAIALGIVLIVVLMFTPDC